MRSSGSSRRRARRGFEFSRAARSGTRMKTPAALRSIPSVDRLARELGELGVPRRVVVAVIRSELAVLREQGLHLSPEQVADRVRVAVEDLCRSRIAPVINGTGIV